MKRLANSKLHDCDCTGRGSGALARDRWHSERGGAAFQARFGPDAARHLARAERALAYLRAHHDALREAGLLALGEKPGDIRLAPRFAQELAALCEPPGS